MENLHKNRLRFFFKSCQRHSVTGRLSNYTKENHFF